ncbi:aminotransferase class V-fold PLP-dependent enzyme [Robertmurraya sp.]|jgi:selenocysteine lyase/cysteine desulfurase|uniref:aminotransferase class V-fold PLP-dependent enzyme n=1 Tax=Robertmurraya sp. TaxID=2837525 RepID=UPI0037037702
MLYVKIGSYERSFNGKLESYFTQFRTETIGTNHMITTPFGLKRMIYADWTASGRLYRPIEKKIIDELGPNVANTHTDVNYSGLFITESYKEAKNIIKKHVNAGPKDVLLSSGTGMTDVVNKLQRILGLRVPENVKKGLKLEGKDRPVIFITHMEHHSNHISWEETIADVVVLKPTKDGMIDVDDLKAMLKKYENRKLKIGSFTACSNVTGVQTPYHKLAAIMHNHGGLCFVDFAASAPYVPINMNPENQEERLDAIFFSPHKFLGGPGSSGILLFDSDLYQNMIPDHPGGGTVTYTNPWGGRLYLKDVEEREDGGTPGFLQTIRSALAIRLKEKMGTQQILAREKEQLDILFPALGKISHLHVFESQQVDRLGIISFHVEGIHYNLFTKLLNDRFGIQVRGGCSCAGTYGHYLLNIDKGTSKQMSHTISKGDLSSKPGWVRLSVHPIMTNEEMYAIIYAIEQTVANINDWANDYMYDPNKNTFYHRKEKNGNGMKGLNY